MNLGKVVGTVVSTRKEPVLDGIRFLLVRLVDPDGKDTSAFVVAAAAPAIPSPIASSDPAPERG